MKMAVIFGEKIDFEECCVNGGIIHPDTDALYLLGK